MYKFGQHISSGRREIVAINDDGFYIIDPEQIKSFQNDGYRQVNYSNLPIYIKNYFKDRNNIFYFILNKKINFGQLINYDKYDPEEYILLIQDNYIEPIKYGSKAYDFYVKSGYEEKNYHGISDSLYKKVFDNHDIYKDYNYLVIEKTNFGQLINHDKYDPEKYILLIQDNYINPIKYGSKAYNFYIKSGYKEKNYHELSDSLYKKLFDNHDMYKEYKYLLNEKINKESSIYRISTDGQIEEINNDDLVDDYFKIKSYWELPLDIQKKVNLEDASNQLYIFNDELYCKNKNNSLEYKKRCGNQIISNKGHNDIGRKKYIIKKLLSLNTTNDGGNKKTDIKFLSKFYNFLITTGPYCDINIGDTGDMCKIQTLNTVNDSLLICNENTYYMEKFPKINVPIFKHLNVKIRDDKLFVGTGDFENKIIVGSIVEIISKQFNLQNYTKLYDYFICRPNHEQYGDGYIISEYMKDNLSNVNYNNINELLLNILSILFSLKNYQYIHGNLTIDKILINEQHIPKIDNSIYASISWNGINFYNENNIVDKGYSTYRQGTLYSINDVELFKNHIRHNSMPNDTISSIDIYTFGIELCLI